MGIMMKNMMSGFHNFGENDEEEDDDDYQKDEEEEEVDDVGFP